MKLKDVHSTNVDGWKINDEVVVKTAHICILWISRPVVSVRAVAKILEILRLRPPTPTYPQKPF